MSKSKLTILLFCVSLFTSYTTFLSAQVENAKESTLSPKKAAKYGKVKLETTIINESTDVIKASLICGQDTLKEDFRLSGSFFWDRVPIGIAQAIVYADGYISASDTLLVKEGQTSKKRFHLTDRVIQLQTVIVKGKVPPLVYRGDTIRFNPLGINIMEDDVARNILEQMPGVKVSDQSVEVAGKIVKKTYIDGKKVFGENPMDALNHLPANDVVHIYAYDEDEHKEQTRKNRRGKRQRVLNIETKSKLVNSKEGGLITSIGGNLEKQNIANHDVRYGAGGTFNFFSEKMLLAVNVMQNNLNRATNRPDIFLSTQSPPQIYNENNYTGFSLSRRWEKETGFYKEIKSDYQFVRTVTETNTRSEQDYFATNAFERRTYINQNQAKNRQNRHNMKIGFDMNDKKWGTLKIDYTLSTNNHKETMQQQVENLIDEKQSNGTLYQGNNGKAINIQSMINWSKYFGNWQYSVATNYTNHSSDDTENRENETGNQTTSTLQEILFIPKDDRGNKWEVNTQLRRNISEENNRYIAFEYQLLSDNQHTNQIAWNKLTDEIDPINTYGYRNQLTEHTSQLNIDLEKMGIFDISIFTGWKQSTIKDMEKTKHSDYNKTFNAFIGNISIKIGRSLSDHSSHLFAYGISNKLPNITQLRPDLNNSNPYFLISGNPDLKTTTSHKLYWNEQFTLNDYGHLLNSELTLTFLQNSISNRTTYFNVDTYLPELKYTATANSSLSSYDNLNGTWKAQWLLMWSYPLNKIKSNINFTTMNEYEHAPYFYDNVRDVARITNLGATTIFSTNLIPRLRGHVSYNIRYRFANNKISNQSSKILTNRLSIDLKCTPIFKYFFANMNYKYGKQNNKTYQRKEQEHMLNIYAGAKLFKRRAELSVTAYDILNSYQNQIFVMQENYTTTIDRENFGRYFTINFSWKFRKIKSNRIDVSRGVIW